MKNNAPKLIAFKTLTSNKLYSLNTFNDLLRIIEDKQFNIIEYKKYSNSNSVAELIKKLQIENEIEQNDSFLYIRDNLKFIFINSDVSEQDKCALLRHELGHICDPELKSTGINHSAINREEFANEFSCYAKNPGICFKIYVFCVRKWRLLAVVVLIACVLGFLSMINHPTSPVTEDTPIPSNSDSTYYVTSGGEKYHRDNCIIIKYRTNLTELTLNEAINDGYGPCMICNPEASKQVY